jgi:hypothetical protein
MSHHDKAKDNAKPGPEEGVRSVRSTPDEEELKDTEGHKLPDMKPGEAAVGPEDEGKPGPEDFVRN